MGLLVWSPLAGGFISGKFTRNSEDKEGRRAKFDFPPINKEKAYDIIDVLLKIGKNHGVSAARVALKWLLTKDVVTSVIIGAKTKEQLNDNIESTQLELSEEEIKELDEVSALTPEYPGWMLNMQGSDRVHGGVRVLPEK